MRTTSSIFAAFLILAASTCAHAYNGAESKKFMEKLELTNKWDKVFPQSDKVAHRKVTFNNRYGINGIKYSRRVTRSRTAR